VTVALGILDNAAFGLLMPGTMSMSWHNQTEPATFSIKPFWKVFFFSLGLKTAG
jgi:hypothetical protein